MVQTMRSAWYSIQFIVDQPQLKSYNNNKRKTETRNKWNDGAWNKPNQNNAI